MGQVSAFVSFFYCFLATFIYVISLYIGPYRGNRNSTPVLLQRLFSALIGSWACIHLAIIFKLVAVQSLPVLSALQISLNRIELIDILPQIGFKYINFNETVAYPTFQTLWFFIGSIYIKYRDVCKYGIINELFTNDDGILIFIRSYIVGPITEEIVFRGCMFYALNLCNVLTTADIILYSPFFFAIAHVHHGIFQIFQENRSLISVLMNVIFQMAYTTLFGWYAMHLLISTKSLIPPIIAHIICNYFEIPDLFSSNYPDRKYFTFGLHFIGVYGFLRSVGVIKSQ